jgi:hypothetical protein
MPAGNSAVTATADRSAVWPNPPTNPTANSSLDTATTGGAIAAAQASSTSSDDTSDALPDVAPIAGRIPLPRQRPNLVAMMPTNMMQTNATQTNVTPTGVPLPRARPTDAPATPSDAPTDENIFTRYFAH